MKVVRTGNIYDATINNVEEWNAGVRIDSPVKEAHVFIFDSGGIEISQRYPDRGGYPGRILLGPFVGFETPTTFPQKATLYVDEYGEIENPNYWEEKEIPQEVQS